MDNVGNLTKNAKALWESNTSEEKEKAAQKRAAQNKAAQAEPAPVKAEPAAGKGVEIDMIDL